jgi:hypothetical protein
VAILELLDFRSRRVVLPAGIWKNKILVAHPEVEPYLETEIPKAVTAPAFVNVDKLFVNRHCHYLELPLNARRERRYLKVVIEYHEGTTPEVIEGTILSVYRVGRVPAQEARIWP